MTPLSNPPLTDPIDILTATRPAEEDLARAFDTARTDHLLEVVRARGTAPASTATPARAATPAPRRGRRWLAVGLVAAAAAGALAIGPSLLDPRGAAPASALTSLAVTAAAQQEGPIPAGKFAHLTVREVQSGLDAVAQEPSAHAAPTPGPSTTPRSDTPPGPDVTTVRELWIGADGSMYGEYTSAGRTQVYLFPASSTANPAAMAALPTDPTALFDWLSRHTSGSNSPHEAVFVGVGDLMRTGHLPPAVARAAIEALGKLPEVTTAKATTPSGTPGIRVVFRDESVRAGSQYLLFDSASADLVQEGSDDGQGHAFTAVRSDHGLVDAVPQRIVDVAVDTSVGADKPSAVG
jgi:hypothetical protein